MSESTPGSARGLLLGKRCLIVGGTSGIGLEIARTFVAEGAKLVISGLDQISEATATSAALAGFKCNAIHPHEVSDLFRNAIGQLDGLDVLVHVAGGSGRRYGDGPIHECTDMGWQATIELNLHSTFLTNREAIRHFLTQKQPGVVLNMASVLAIAPAPTYFDTCAYAAAKGGVVSLSQHLASRYSVQGIRVNVLAPALIDTPSSQRAVGDAAIRAYLQVKQPLAGGPGKPEDVAGAAAFLCSDRARLLTGIVLPIDAGWRFSDGQQIETEIATPQEQKCLA